MRRLLLPMLLLSAAAWGGSLDDCMGSAGTMPEVGGCLQQRHAQAESRLAATEARVAREMAELDQITAGRYAAARSHRQARQAFARYRERQCRWVAASYASGNGAEQARLACQTDLDEQRLQALLAHSAQETSP